MERVVAFVLAGVVAQLVNGSLGMGFGVTSTTALLAGGTAPVMASATVHLAKIGVGVASGAAHWRHGNVSWRLVVLLGVPGAAGAFVGATLLSHLDGDAARPIVAALLAVLGLRVVATYAFGRTPVPAPESRLRARSMSPLGVVGGFVDSIGGGGWGPITTPTLLSFGRLEPHRAIGSVSAAECLVAIAATAGFLAGPGTGPLDLGLVLALGGGGIAIAPLAARLARKLPAAVSGTLVGVLVIVVNTSPLLDAAGVGALGQIVAVAVLGSAGVVLAFRTHAESRRRLAAAAA